MKPSEKLWQIAEVSAQYQSLYELAMKDEEATQEDLDMIGREAAEIIREIIYSFLEEHDINDVEEEGSSSISFTITPEDMKLLEEGKEIKYESNKS